MDDTLVPLLAAARAAGRDALLEPEELYELVRSSVVTVNVVVGGTEEGNGSGAVVGWDELGQLYILTNRHVVYHELPEGEELCFEAELELAGAPWTPGRVPTWQAD